jgi:hypothetical protein
MLRIQLKKVFTVNGKDYPTKQAAKAAVIAEELAAKRAKVEAADKAIEQALENLIDTAQEADPKPWTQDQRFGASKAVKAFIKQAPKIVEILSKVKKKKPVKRVQKPKAAPSIPPPPPPPPADSRDKVDIVESLKAGAVKTKTRRRPDSSEKILMKGL